MDEVLRVPRGEHGARRHARGRNHRVRHRDGAATQVLRRGDGRVVDRRDLIERQDREVFLQRFRDRGFELLALATRGEPRDAPDTCLDFPPGNSGDNGMTLRFVVRALSCAGLISLAGCQFGAADRINAALPPGPEVTIAREALFTGARMRKIDASALDAALRVRMEKRALDCAKGYTPGVFDGNDQIREKLTDRACFANADAQLRDWMLERYTGMFGVPPNELRPSRVASAPRVRIEPERATGAPMVAPPPAPAPTIGVNAVPSTPRPVAATPPSDIDASASPAPPSPETAPAGQIDVPTDARVLAIGIYEAADGVHSFNGPRKAGTVQVFVMKSARPIVLVLSSYEPVNWNLQLQDGAKVSHVLLSGYHASQVFGAREASIESIGTQYAYQRGSVQFETLDGLVRQFTGKRIGSFQGAYSGGSFTLN